MVVNKDLVQDILLKQAWLYSREQWHEKVLVPTMRS